MMLKEEKSYDRLPNFTVSRRARNWHKIQTSASNLLNIHSRLQAIDVVRVLGVGRNEYIAMLNSCKGRRLMWRLNPKASAEGRTVRGSDSGACLLTKDAL